MSPRWWPDGWLTDCADRIVDPRWEPAGCPAGDLRAGPSSWSGDALPTRVWPAGRTGDRAVDPMDRIDQIISVVETARNVPMSRNCMIDRSEMVGLLEQHYPPER